MATQRVKSLLTLEGTIKALKVKTRRIEKMTDDEWLTSREKDKPEKMLTEEWEDLKDMATSTILLCFANNILREIFGLTNLIGIWDKLESRYKSKIVDKYVVLEETIVWSLNDGRSRL